MQSKRDLLALTLGTVATLGLIGCADPDDSTEPEQRDPRDPQGLTAGLDRFARIDRVVYAADGLPDYVRGELGTSRGAPMASTAEAASALAPALPAIAALFRLQADDLAATGMTRDHLGMTHVRYQQHKHGLRVVGGDLVVHVAPDGAVRSVTSTARDGIALDPSPAIGEAAAAVAAQAATAGTTEVRNAELTYVFATGDGQLYLTWELLLVGTDSLLVDLVYVDAHGGRVVDRRPQVFTAKARDVFDGQNRSPPFFGSPGPRLASEGMPPTADPIGLAAYDNTGVTYDCYQALFGRDSYDGSGAALQSVVHVLFRTQNGTTGNNAAWVANPFAGGGQMVYGDGDGMLMGPTSQGFDVTAHELTHAVTSSTAKLAYQNESGALNEGLSDILASVCEAWRDRAISDDTWLIGEEIFTPATAGDALRYMANPTADRALYPPQFGGSRDFYADRFTGAEDNGGVHLNSGIANLGFHLLVVGGVHPRTRTTFPVPAIGIEKAGAIYQRALTQGYFTANTTFAQARTGTEEAARDLYSPADATAVGIAWAAVGVGQLPPADATPPTVQITSPAAGAKVPPGFAVDVTAADDQGVLRVELSIDGAVVGTDAIAPYTFPTALDLAVGPHTVTATAFDSSNQATASVDVTVAIGACAPACAPGTHCEDGMCLPGNPEDGDGGGCGCASGGSGGAAGSAAVGVLLALWLRRRRRPTR